MRESKTRWLRRIEELDPERDHHEIYRISSGYEFPWDYQRSLELALFKTYCVPSISALLDATGEFRDRPQRRYDDTALLMAEIADHGYDSERGREALRVVNQAHGRYAISNDDMRYVLSTFVYEPLDWLDRFGWRPLTDAERRSAYLFYRAVGVRMGIKDIPPSFESFAEFKLDYEREHFRYSVTNERIGTYTLELMAGWYPKPFRPLARMAARGMLDDRMLTAFGFEAAPRWLPPLEAAALRARSRVVRLLPPRTESVMTKIGTNRTYPGYPEGYRPSDLGAPPPPADIDPAWLSPRRTPGR
jgi:uncharacterized protein (DUF2236 family)